MYETYYFKRRLLIFQSFYHTKFQNPTSVISTSKFRMAYIIDLTY